MSEFQSHILSTGETYITHFDGSKGKTFKSPSDYRAGKSQLSPSQTPAEVQSTSAENHCEFNYQDQTIAFNSEGSLTSQLAALETVFNYFDDLKSLTLKNAHADFATKFGITQKLPRNVFYQIPTIHSFKKDNSTALDYWTTTQIKHWDDTLTISHPVRPLVQEGQTLYRRYHKGLNKTLSLRVIDRQKDLDLFTEWQNKPRVAHFWELSQSKAELQEYLTKGLNDPHQFPAIYELDGVPVGYFEFYWVPEDRLGPYYDSEAYDRGFHLLVGNDDYLGFKNTDAMLKAVGHFIYLADIRTRRIMAEPRHDNLAILKYVDTFKAWRKIKEFDFPHKRSALLECSRDKFFAGEYL